MQNPHGSFGLMFVDVVTITHDPSGSWTRLHTRGMSLRLDRDRDLHEGVTFRRAALARELREPPRARVIRATGARLLEPRAAPQRRVIVAELGAPLHLIADLAELEL